MTTDPYTLERVTPAEIVCGGAYVPVMRTVAHPPGSHAASPILNELTAVELVTARGSRWVGTSRAWIGSDLEMHLMVDPRDEGRAGWDAGVDEHAGGQFRLAVAGEQVPLLPLPDDGIPALEPGPSPAEVEADRRARAGTDAGLAEEVALERLAVAALTEEADRYWRSCNFGLSAEASRLAEEAAARVERLEGIEAGGV